MNTSPSTAAAPAPSAVRIVLTILDALLRAIGERGRPMSWATWVLPVERIMLADAWVRKFRRAFKALAAKILNGTLRERPYAPRGPASAPTPPLPRARAALRVPRRKWWLSAWVPMRAAGCGNQLTHLLRHNEEMQKLVASERMYWLIRPVCRALAVDPNELTKAAVRGVALWEAAASRPALEAAVSPDTECSTDGDTTPDASQWENAGGAVAAPAAARTAPPPRAADAALLENVYDTGEPGPHDRPVS